VPHVSSFQYYDLFIRNTDMLSGSGLKVNIFWPDSENGVFLAFFSLEKQGTGVF